MASGVVGIADSDTDPDLVEMVGQLSCRRLQLQLDDVSPFHGPISLVPGLDCPPSRRRRLAGR